MAPEEAKRIFAEADLVVPAEAIQAAINRVADDIATRLRDANPLVLTVMGGAVVFAGQLLPKLPFPMDCDYLHVTRYGAVTNGGELDWVVKPRLPVQGREVLVLDDILDEGVTLAAVKSHLMTLGATSCHIAVLCEKDLGRAKPVTADFVGVRLPNRFVFGCGMDVKGAWRNLPAIYAVKGL